MPTIFSHPAVPLAIAPWLRRTPPSLILLGAVLSIIPDVDVLAFRAGIPYAHPLGHRGLTHSVMFAVVLASVAAVLYVRLRPGMVRFREALIFLLVAIVSHGLLDAMTNGGKGVGLFIPFSMKRYFFGFHPIRVSPIGAARFVEKASLVLSSELRWVWLPAGILASLGFLTRRLLRGNAQAG